MSAVFCGNIAVCYINFHNAVMSVSSDFFPKDLKRLIYSDKRVKYC